MLTVPVTVFLVALSFQMVRGEILGSVVWVWVCYM